MAAPSTSEENIIFTGAEIAWVMALSELHEEESMREFFPELLLLLGRRWIESDDPLELAGQLRMPIEVVNPIVARFKEVGLWCPIGAISELDALGEEYDPLERAISLTMMCMVGRGSLTASFSKVQLGLADIDGREMRPLMRRLEQGAFSVQALRSFLKDGPPERLSKRRALLKQLIVSRRLLRSAQRWYFSAEVTRDWMYTKVEKETPAPTWSVGSCAPLRPRPAFIRLLLEDCGIKAESLAGIWHTDTATVDLWLKRILPPPPPPPVVQMPPSEARVEVGHGLVSKDLRRGQTGIIIEVKSRSIAVRWQNGVESEVQLARVNRYTLLGPVNIEGFPARRIEAPRLGMRVQSTDKRRNDQGTVVEVQKDAILVKWPRGVVAAISMERLGRYTFSVPRKEPPMLDKK